MPPLFPADLVLVDVHVTGLEALCRWDRAAVHFGVQVPPDWEVTDQPSAGSSLTAPKWKGVASPEAATYTSDEAGQGQTTAQLAASQLDSLNSSSVNKNVKEMPDIELNGVTWSPPSVADRLDLARRVHRSARWLHRQDRLEPRELHHPRRGPRADQPDHADGEVHLVTRPPPPSRR